MTAMADHIAILAVPEGAGDGRGRPRGYSCRWIIQNRVLRQDAALPGSPACDIVHAPAGKRRIVERASMDPHAATASHQVGPDRVASVAETTRSPDQGRSSTARPGLQDRGWMETAKAKARRQDRLLALMGIVQRLIQARRREVLDGARSGPPQYDRHQVLRRRLPRKLAGWQVERLAGSRPPVIPALGLVDRVPGLAASRRADRQAGKAASA